MNKNHQKWGWVFVSPFLIGFLVFTLIPLLFSIYISFTKYNLFNPPDWVGLKNYIKAFNHPELWVAFRNIFVYGVIYEGLQLSLGCVLATMLNQKIKGMSFFRIVYFLPVLTPFIAVSYVWTSMYNPTYGIFNYLFSLIGAGPFKYVFSTNWLVVIVSIAVMNVWKGVGYTTIFLLSGMQSISDDLYEAAEIDGAGKIRKFFNITLPLLTPTLFYLLMIGVINAMKAFDSFYIMAQTTGNNTPVLGTLIYDSAMLKGNYGLSAAYGWITFAVTAVLTIIQKRLEKRWVHYV